MTLHGYYVEHGSLIGIVSRLLDARQRVLSEIKNIEDAAQRDPTSVSLVWQRMSSFKEQLETELLATKQAASRRVGKGL